MAATAQRPITEPPEIAIPDYNLYQFRPDFYKVVRNNSTTPRTHLPRISDEGYKHNDKLPQALSRARRVCLELALCNDWKWFATFTIAKNNYDRSNLDGFYERFTDFIKYRREKYGVKIPYLLVPEQHGDGAWHLHGFFNADIDPLLKSFRKMDAEGYRSENGKRLPRKLLKKDYYNMPDYQKRFGFCSFGKIRNHDATAFYATKYISKSFQGDAKRVGLQLYYCSQGLNRAQYYDSVYKNAAIIVGSTYPNSILENGTLMAYSAAATMACIVARFFVFIGCFLVNFKFIKLNYTLHLSDFQGNNKKKVPS